MTSKLARLGISALAPGVWRAALPFPSTLDYSFSYFVRTGSGFIAVDLGWDSDEAWDLFQAGLRHAGGTLDDLIGAVITHAHPDHYGLARRVRSHSSAWIAMHSAELPQIASSDADKQRRLGELAEWLRACGAPPSQLERLRADGQEIRAHVPSIRPDIELVDGEAVPDTDGRLVAIHTPGHTPGHLCYHHRELNLAFTGDHILPRVTPNVSKRPTSGEDPLNDFAHALGKLASLSDPLVLPGHEWSFDRLGARIAALQRHHEQRLDEMADAVRSGRETVWEVAELVSWSRPLDKLDGRATRSALGETFAHLYRLSAAGRLTFQPGVPHRWRSASRPAADR